ncbi:hypothetical protein [Sediminitomix flava]|uniref:Uncharacterized protein n=1 Tax=Sediminitomix flava TaxID=379075 RepID=A0A315ZH29_SEDFL|nr:hypothetical protein [Sediminitomix flava]PWJ44479.1 hypothetical protein BC781_101850 [Sediminitomix flava]
MKSLNFKAKISPKVVIFSRWTRKRYTLFSILGKQVKIGRLSIDICRQSLKTGKRRIIQILIAEREGKLQELEEDSGSLVDHLLLTLQGLLTSPSTLSVECESVLGMYFYKKWSEPTSV